MTHVTVRPAVSADVETILEFIKGLAVYEHQPDAVKTTAADLRRDGFGASPKFESLIAEVDGRAIGFALFYPSYSTWEGGPSLYLEDIFVAEPARSLGVGRALMSALAVLAVERGWQRLDLQVLDWNPARAFYANLGAQQLGEWLPYRVSGPALLRLAADDQPPPRPDEDREES